ncbi:MAG TPA: hypothetical protein VFU82_02435 [Gammaproteobacteria bacterium]|nr:hypothetical protein [Gammaproteobacteria bacterium]
MGQALVYFNAGSGELVCADNWDIASLPTIQTLLKSFVFPSASSWLLASLDIVH